MAYTRCGGQLKTNELMEKNNTTNRVLSAETDTSHSGYARLGDVICWWSGGVTSAVAIWLAIQIYGADRIRIIFIDTFNEDDDTYRFKKDCEKWYGIEIETISAIGKEFKRIQDVWYKYKSLNVATGAICSVHLKRLVREKWEKENKYTHQVFGFDISESKRAIQMRHNAPTSKAVFPLLFNALSKKDCIEILKYEFIPIPLAYWLGFQNNNCLKTGCVQGGMGYWQKMWKERKTTYLRMAVIEKQLTELSGEPVTMLKDQTNEAKLKDKKEALVFLVPNKQFPSNKSLFDFKQMPLKPLFECNGFCSTSEGQRNPTENEINYANVVNDVA